MRAVDLLERLEILKVSTTLENGELALRPGIKVPDEIIPELKENKAELTLLLSLLERLRAGHAWLLQQYALSFRDDFSEQQRDMFSKGMATWDELEREVRSVHGYSACVFGLEGRCPPDSPVLCDECVGVRAVQNVTQEQRGAS